jgi:predicted enzyme related to lactoylglutathione lyase
VGALLVRRTGFIISGVQKETHAESAHWRLSMANTSNGNFVWYEHLTKDASAAISFYTDVVGWKTQPFGDGGDYVMWVGSEGPLGGVMALTDEATKMGARPCWMGHVQVEDVDATAALTKKLGGKVYKEPADIPTVGRFAILADPQGASLSVFKPSGAMTLHDASKQGEFCWRELMTSDSAAAFAFYSELFGWKILNEMDMGPIGTYRVFGVGETQLGGMMTTPKGAPMPPMWLYYTGTSDLDPAIERATKRGATIMNGPMDVPGGGRIAQLMDPQGAPFALHQAPKK